MSNVIELLERMGQDAEAQSQEVASELIEKSSVNEKIKAALLSKDKVSLERQLDICPDVVAFLLPAEDEEKEDESEENEEKVSNG